MRDKDGAMNLCIILGITFIFSYITPFWFASGFPTPIEFNPGLFGTSLVLAIVFLIKAAYFSKQPYDVPVKWFGCL